LNSADEVSDNAGMMAMNLLEKLGVGKLALAGFDGFGKNDNYYTDKILTSADNVRIENMNFHIAERIDKLRQSVPVTFVTKSSYDKRYINQ
jgi:4-hydroxy 2-oxovalerate aldolase